MKIVCCVCKKVNIDGKWVSDTSSDEGDASHTYCPNCQEEAIKQLKKEATKHRANGGGK